MHHGSLRTRLGDPVAKAFVDDQLRFDAPVFEALAQLVGIGDRHAAIEFAVLDQRRRACLLDVRHRRGLLVHRRIVDRIVAEILNRERRDVGVVVVRRPVRDTGTNRDRLEPIARCREEGGNVAPLAPAHARDALWIHPSLLHEVIDAAHNVPRITDAQVADVELPEGLAISRAAAVVDLQDQCAARHPDVGWVIARVRREQRWTIDTRWSAMNDAEERILLRRIEVRRLDQHAFDWRAVSALPRDHLARTELERLRLVAHLRQHPRRERLHVRDEDLVQRRWGGGRERHALAVTSEAEAAGHEVVRAGHPGDRNTPRIDAEEMSRCLLKAGEVDAVGHPADEPWLLVELVGDRARRAARSGNHRQSRVGMEEQLVPHCGREHELFPIGRPARAVVRSGLRDDLLHIIAPQVEDVDVGGTALHQVRIDGAAERDAAAVG